MCPVTENLWVLLPVKAEECCSQEEREDFRACTPHRPQHGDGHRDKHGHPHRESNLAPFHWGFKNSEEWVETGSSQNSPWGFIIHAAVTKQRSRGGEPAPGAQHICLALILPA